MQTTKPEPLGHLDEAPLSPRQRYAAILIASGEFIDGYDLIVMGAALILLRPQFGLSPQQTGALGASTFLGAMLGLLVFGDMSDRWGRRAIFVANLLFCVVFSIVSAFVQSVPQLFIARFLVGIGVGMDIPTSAAYLAEIAPRRQRGIISGSLLNIMWILGAMASNLIALPLLSLAGADAWRWMFGLAAIPAALVLLGRQILPESPRWLAAHGRIEEARQALGSFGIEADAAGLARLTTQRGSYRELFRQPYRSRALLVALIFFLNCVAGPLSTIAAPFVLRTVGALSNEATLLFSSLVWCTSLAGVLLGLVFDRPDQSAPAALHYCDPGRVRCTLHGYSGTGPPVDAGGRLLRLQLLQLARTRCIDMGMVERTVPDPASWALARLLQWRMSACDRHQHLSDPDRGGNRRVYRFHSAVVGAPVRLGFAGEPVRFPRQRPAEPRDRRG